MEKITSGLPPLSLPPYHHPSPPNTQTLISPINPNLSSFPLYINSQSIRIILLLLHLFLSLSLSSLSYATPFVISQGFRLFISYGDPQFLSFSLGAFHIPTCCIIGLPCG
ncbi:hypothetical protein L1987_28993 [Smallanthus sonchifolius]|uniref:Uncharacterized protein n=1 Tax=Smallanthus sonchifolius TaxID=185202 RepID=A0ACB9HYP0_9ASTR|nr:hypothetical protein L1987_28993 [Smallanthus sonchifolius]